MYAPVLTLSTEDGNKLLQQLKTGFKKKLLHGINIFQKCLNRAKLTISIL